MEISVRSLYVAVTLVLALTSHALPDERLPERIAGTIGALPDRGLQRINVTFRQPVPAAVLRQFDFDGTVLSLTYQWQDQKAIYRTDPADPVETMTRNFAQRLEQVLQAHAIAGVEEQLADIRSRGLAVSAMEIEGTRSTLHAAVDAIVRAGHGGLIDGIDGPAAPDRQARANADFGRVETLGAAPYPNEPWRFSPSSGSLSNNPAAKTISSTFRWTDVSGFTTVHKGYEHDIVVSGIPGMTTAANSLYWSDLPDWYVDDYYGDDPSKGLTLTVGTGSAPSIQANKDYKVIVAYTLGTQNYAGVIGRIDVRPTLGSWAGSYDEGDPNPGEAGETFYCQTRGLGRWARNCIFADQANSDVKLYESTAASAPLYAFAPIDVTRARTFYWNKSYSNASKVCTNQYLAEYYKGNTITPFKQIFVRCEPAVNHNWGYGGPEPDLTNNFTVRWKGHRHFNTGRYRFTVRHDDGASLQIGSYPALYDLRSGPVVSTTKDLQITGGTYSVTAEYYEGSDAASMIMGWEVLPATPVTVLSEGAEGGAWGWSLSGWGIQASSASYAGYRRFLIGNGTAYTNNMSATLTSPSFSLAGRTTATLSFAYKHDTETNYDFFWAEVSGDGGATWTRVSPRWSGLSPNGAYWSSATFALPSAVLGKSAVRVRFRFTSDSSVIKWGAAVDEVKVIAQ